MRDPVIIGDATLYLGDCMDILPMLVGKMHLLATDPPYGIKRDNGFGGGEGFWGGGRPIARTKYQGDWDSEIPTKECFTAILSACDSAVIFGGNFFTEHLPVGNHWLVWDKLNTMPSFGDCELAWTNIKRNSVKKLTVEYNGLFGKEKARHHATQKPLRVMSYVVDTYSKVGETVFDPFMGSGTSGVAAIELGRKFVGIERDPHYFAIACERISAAEKQNQLFAPEPIKQVQEALL